VVGWALRIGKDPQLHMAALKHRVLPAADATLPPAGALLPACAAAATIGLSCLIDLGGTAAWRIADACSLRLGISDG